MFDRFFSKKAQEDIDDILNDKLKIKRITISSNYNCFCFYNDYMVEIYLPKAPIDLPANVSTTIATGLPTIGSSAVTKNVINYKATGTFYVSYLTNGTLTIEPSTSYTAGNWTYINEVYIRYKA